MEKKVSKNKKNRKNQLIFLAIISFFILPISYSRYIERENGSTQVTLAKWNISFSPTTEEELNLVSHSETTADYIFEITNISEVASDYSITLTNVPEDVSVIIDNNGETLTPDAENKIVVEELGSFNVEDANSTHTHTITFKTSEDTVAQDDKVNVEYDVLIKQRIDGGEG